MSRRAKVPIVVDLADTDLVRCIALLDQGLADLERALAGIGE